MTRRRRRQTDWGLLLSACVVVFVARAVVHAEAEALAWRPAALIAALLLVTGVWLRLRLPRHDPFLFPVAALLIGLSLSLLSALRPAFALKQEVWAALGMVVLAAAAQFPHWRRLCDFPYLTMVVAAGLLLLTSVAGKPVGAAGDVKLGINLGFLSFQPSELARVALVFFLAGYLGGMRHQLSVTPQWWRVSRDDLRYLGPMLVMWVLSLSLLVLQKDLGAALLYYSLFVALLYLATGRFLYVLLGGGTFLAGAAAAYRLLPVVAVRLNLWLDPWSAAQDRGYQTLQGLFSLGAGGNWGTGLGVGDATRVPAVHTDLIFAAVGEQLGLVGAVCVLLCYAVIVHRGYHIAIASQDDQRTLLAAGLTTAFALQTFVIVAGVLKVTPLTGVTLPFLSYGGTSLVVNCLALGILLSLSREQSDGLG